MSELLQEDILKGSICYCGPKGDKGEKGDRGSDATVTTENVKAAGAVMSVNGITPTDGNSIIYGNDIIYDRAGSPDDSVKSIIQIVGQQASSAYSLAHFIDTKIPSEAAANNKLIASSQKGAANGIATLDANTKVPKSQLPIINATNSVGADAIAIGSTAKAYGKQSVAIGDNVSAGCLCYYYSNYDHTAGTDTFKVVLRNEMGFAGDTSQLAVGDVFSMKCGRSCNFLGTIVSISQVNNFTTFKVDDAAIFDDTSFKPEEHQSFNTDKGYIWVPSKPTAGDIKLGDNTFVSGKNNVANETNAFVIGQDNVADGRYSAVFGKTNKASYCATAIGNATEAMGYRSLASGYATKTSGNASISGGLRTEAKGDYSIALGTASVAQGQGAVATGDETHANGLYSLTAGRQNTAGYEAQTVIGKYNDNKSDTLFEVGNGTSAAHSNALEVKTDGTIIVSKATTNNDGYKTLTTKGYVDNLIIASKVNPEFQGSISINRKYGSIKGTNSVSIGTSNEATNDNTIAFGYQTRAEGFSSIAANRKTYASGYGSMALGNETKTTGAYSFAQGMYTTTNKDAQMVVGNANDNKVGDLFEVGNGQIVSKTIFTNDHSQMIGYYYNKVLSSNGQIENNHILITASNYEEVWIDNTITYVFKHSNAFEVKDNGQIIGGRSTKNDDNGKTLLTKDFLIRATKEEKKALLRQLGCEIDGTGYVYFPEV